jgi:hypothetical protein
MCEIMSLQLFEDGGFLEKNSENVFFPQKMCESKKWYNQKVLLKSFPMNGHLNMFRQS